jgi:hypothetical protein
VEGVKREAPLVAVAVMEGAGAGEAAASVSPERFWDQRGFPQPTARRKTPNLQNALQWFGDPSFIFFSPVINLFFS